MKSELLLLLAVLASCECSWWMDQPYKSSQDFNTRALYGSNITLECEDEFTEGKSYRVLYWVRPDLTVMEDGQIEEFHTLDGAAGWRVHESGMKLTITLLQERQFGFYHCVISDSPNRYTVKKAVNYKGPFFGDLWPEYRMNVIVGCSSAAIFLAISIACIVIYEWKFATDDDEFDYEYDYNKPHDNLEDRKEMNTNDTLSPENKKEIYAYDNEVHVMDEKSNGDVAYSNSGADVEEVATAL